MDIADWLRQIGLERYAEAFEDNDVDAEVLRTLGAEDLKELGVTSLGHRKRLLQAIAGLSDLESDRLQPAGAPDAPAWPEAERRQLTVSFCDLVGSTELASRLDPEDMGALMRAYHAACAETVARWGGHVAKLMGDGVLAYFGYPQAHEDDAERAVRAAIDLVRSVAEISAAGRPLAVRVGIATGLVMVGELVGEGAAQEQTVVGETPNLAARLQAMAEPGSVVIAASTHRLLGGLFLSEDLGQRTLKGFRDPVQAFRIVADSGAANRFEALRGQLLMPLVGREHELGLLLERFERAKEGEGQVVLLSGEPGIGKSRLVRALRERLEDEPYTALTHHGSSYHTNSALYPVIRLLERAAGFTRDDPLEARLGKLEALLARGTDDPARALPLVAALLGMSTSDREPRMAWTPQEQKQRTFEVLLDQVTGLARQQPLLVIYEDVHWFDPTTLELLDLLVDRAQQLPALVLMTLRPEFSPPWTGRAHVTQLSLSRLVRRHGSAMVARVTGGKPLPQEVLAQILERTDGVPLFVEEVTKTVLESGLLREQSDRYELDGALPPLAIPSSLQDSLMARLDRLGPVKEIAQIGAVIGREFTYELLAAVAARSEQQLGADLDRLVASGLAFRRGDPPAATYSFKHALVQDTAYRSLLKSRRQQLHARIATSLEERFPDAVHGQPEVLAHHYTQADLVPRAVLHWLNAGRKAAESSADLEAFAHLSNGLELVGRVADPREAASQELDLCIALGPVLMNLKGSAAPEVGEAYRRAQELCRKVGRAEQAFPTLWGLWFHHHTGGELRIARKLGDDLIEVAEALPETVFALQGRHAAWTTHSALGEFAASQRHIERGLEVYDPERHPASAFVYGGHDAGVCGYSSGALNTWALGHHERALQFGQESVALAERLGHPFSMAHALCYRAILHQLRGEPDAVAQDADRLAAHCARHDLRIWARNAEILSAWTMLVNGETEQGLRQFREALAARRATRVTHRQPYYLALQAEALGSAGQAEQAAEAISEAVDLTDSTEDRRWEALVHRVRGDLLLVARPRDAEAALSRAIETARGQEAKSLELRAATSLARLLVEQGKRQDARDLLAPLFGWFTDGFETRDLKQAKALLDALS